MAAERTLGEDCGSEENPSAPLFASILVAAVILLSGLLLLLLMPLLLPPPLLLTSFLFRLVPFPSASPPPPLFRPFEREGGIMAYAPCICVRVCAGLHNCAREGAIGCACPCFVCACLCGRVLVIG